MRFSLAMLGSAALVVGACGGSTDAGLGGGAGSGATDGGAATGGSAGAGGGSAGSGGSVGGSGGNVGGSGGAIGGSGGTTGGAAGAGGNIGGNGGNVGGMGGNIGGNGGNVGGMGGNIGGSGGGSAGAATTCSGVCQKMDQANCPNSPSYSACFAGCQIDVNNYQAECGSQVSAWLTCAQTNGQVSCDNDGEAIVKGCNSQLVAFTQCAACIPSTGDDACEACTKSSCCNQLKAVYSHPQFAPYLDCFYACTTQPCINACYLQYSGLHTPITQLTQCQGTSCAAC